jgi:shikimate kinase
VEPIVFIGMMGAGKTTVGRAYAARHGLAFIDSDQELEARTGVSIPTIFAVEGEEGFRERETRLLAELLGREDVVLATGGGVVLRPENRAQLRRRGIVVYLHVPPEVLWERLRHDRHRPLLQVPQPRQRIFELYAQRDPLYREAADIVVDGGRMKPAAMLARVEEAVRDYLSGKVEGAVVAEGERDA